MYRHTFTQLKYLKHDLNNFKITSKKNINTHKHTRIKSPARCHVTTRTFTPVYIHTFIQASTYAVTTAHTLNFKVQCLLP